MIRRRAPLALLAALLAACAARPARFADFPIVTEISDDTPIPQPAKLLALDEIYFTDAYVRRPLVLALDPSRPAAASDVNALDEVPRSSWFDSPQVPEVGPPTPPFTALPGDPESGQHGLAIVDARGIHWELRRDPPERAEVRSAGAAVATRLLRAAGWSTPEVHVLTIVPRDLVCPAEALDKFRKDGPEPATSASYRVRAMRWPIGIDVGPTPVTGLRPGDPNDFVPHAERRTLRALKLALYWVGATWLGPGALRDAYIGPPDLGHIVHYVVGLDSGLGADEVGAAEEARLAGGGKNLDINALTALATLGLGVYDPPPLQTKWPGLGDFEPDVAPETFEPRPPFEPIDRILPADMYWAAKQIAAVSEQAITDAVISARLSDLGSVARAREVLVERRKHLIAAAIRQVTPAEVESVTRTRLVVRDEAIARELEPAFQTVYLVTLLDDAGRELAAPLWIQAHGPTIPIDLPAGRPGYVVVRARAIRRGFPAPRTTEIHVVRRADGVRVIGVRH